jgi:hypothetical protein
MLTQLCASDNPIALFPVRLETRFFTHATGGSELRVRVYPDKIHLDSHEPEITPSEKEWGEHYWELFWRAGGNAQSEADAWRQLADRFQPARAAWIVRALRPLNPQDRPASPIPPDQSLPRPLQFPTVAVTSDNSDASWRNAPRAQLLPDRWVAIVYSRGLVVAAVVGPDIRRPLAVGPDPRIAAEEIGGDQAAVDPGMKWMIDFDTAETDGMALRIPLTADILAAGVDSLFVLGVAGSFPAEKSAHQLALLLDAQHYTDGLSLLRYGTPSNNTAEQRTAYGSEDVGYQQSFANEIARDPTSLAATSNARQLGLALGLPADQIPQVLGHLPEAALSQELDMRSMNAALWQATWGYFLTNMVGFEGTGLTLESIDWARRHFIDYVRSGGPLPALRCGRQPYGVLPVTSLDLWQPRGGDEAQFARDIWLRQLLQRMRDTFWRAHLGEVARVGRRQTPPDPDADLADVMRTDGISSGYVTRALMGRHYLQHLRAFLAEDLQARGWIAAQDALTADVARRLGFQIQLRVARATYADIFWRVASPLVQSGEVSHHRPLEANYIAALLAEPQIDRITTLHAQVGETASLLHALLRHSMLREHAHATAAILATQPGMSATALLKDQELVNLVPESPDTDTWKRQLDQIVSAITAGQTIRQYLEGLTTFDAPAVAPLGEFKQSLTHLQALDSETLLYLMQGALDLASHRLDAWITSFATKRLAGMRAAKPQGIYVGGYGWVENLRPAPVASAVTPPEGEQGPLAVPGNDSGFIHAPSLTHAATAALLRNAHLGNSGVPQTSSPFAIDLSSRRVRDAKWLLDGVRQGQPLGALLGYRFERRLHEINMDRFIQPFRQIAPLAAGKLEQTSLPLEAITANNVVDGLVLQQMFSAGESALLARLQQRVVANTAEITTLTKELRALNDAVDSIADALTAEAAYQLVRGNASRTASTLSAIANGEAPAPELEVARTPRSGIALTHRVLVLFSGQPDVTTGWAGPDKSVRAAAEPMLNAWVAKLLGDPRNVRCVVEQLEDDTEIVADTRTMLLSELELAPLDVVYGVDAQPRAGQLCEIEQRVLFHARHKVGGFPANARLRVAHARPSDLDSEQLTLLDVLEQAGGVRRLLAGARAAEAADLTPPGQSISGTLDVVDLETRVTKAETALDAAHKALDALVKDGAGADAQSLRTTLLKFSDFGIPGAIPVSQTGDDETARARLMMQATALVKESRARLDRGAALRASPAAAALDTRRDQAIERLRAVFGTSFVALPKFMCDQAGELGSALAASTQVQGGDPLQVYSWFARSERVRDAVSRLGAPLRGAEVLATGEKLRLRVAQLPFGSADRWVGMAPSPGHDVQPGKLSLVVQSLPNFRPTDPLMGLMVDEWVEVVPSRTETTAIAFQYDPPNTCAPQNVLLAVPPVPGKPWTVADLQRVLVETLDLAKLRAVDAEALGELAHYLPALFFAFNAEDDAVSTDFIPLTR